MEFFNFPIRDFMFSFRWEPHNIKITFIDLAEFKKRKKLFVGYFSLCGG